MWILSVLPEFIIHIIFTAGVVMTLAGFLFGALPFISKYKLPIQIIGILVLSLGIYLEGGLAHDKVVQLKIKELEVKLAKAETKAAENNLAIQESVVNQNQDVKQKTQTIIKYIDRVVTKEIPVEIQGPEREKIVEVIKFNETCPLPKFVIEQHNAATVLNKAAEGTK